MGQSSWGVGRRRVAYRVRGGILRCERWAYGVGRPASPFTPAEDLLRAHAPPAQRSAH